MITQEDLIEKVFKQCLDPELYIDVWTLGLIYEVKIEEQKIEEKTVDGKENNFTPVKVLMTFTSPFCPYGPQLVEEIKNKVKEIGGEVEITVTFEPPWTPSEELKVMMGM